MELAVLHVAIPGKTRADLDAAARVVYTCLDVTEYEERESSSYPSERYFRGIKGGASIDVSLEDDPGFHEYQFWVTVKLPSGFPTPLRDFMRVVTASLVRSGMQVSMQDFDDPEASSHKVVRTAFSLDASGPDRNKILVKREVIPI